MTERAKQIYDAWDEEEGFGLEEWAARRV